MLLIKVKTSRFISLDNNDCNITENNIDCAFTYNINNINRNSYSGQMLQFLDIITFSGLYRKVLDYSDKGGPICISCAWHRDIGHNEI